MKCLYKSLGIHANKNPVCQSNKFLICRGVEYEIRTFIITVTGIEKTILLFGELV